MARGHQAGLFWGRYFTVAFLSFTVIRQRTVCFDTLFKMILYTNHWHLPLISLLTNINKTLNTTMPFLNIRLLTVLFCDHTNSCPQEVDINIGVDIYPLAFPLAFPHGVGSLLFGSMLFSSMFFSSMVFIVFRIKRNKTSKQLSNF